MEVNGQSETLAETIESGPLRITDLFQNNVLSMYIVNFTLISNLATDYIQKRKGEPGLFSFEYNLSPKLISK